MSLPIPPGPAATAAGPCPEDPLPGPTAANRLPWGRGPPGPGLQPLYPLQATGRRPGASPEAPRKEPPPPVCASGAARG